MKSSLKKINFEVLIFALVFLSSSLLTSGQRNRGTAPTRRNSASKNTNLMFQPADALLQNKPKYVTRTINTTAASLWSSHSVSHHCLHLSKAWKNGGNAKGLCGGFKSTAKRSLA
jgi:hypothetical protein